VKILDFGLAKALEGEANISTSPTISAVATRAGEQTQLRTPSQGHVSVFVSVFLSGRFFCVPESAGACDEGLDLPVKLFCLEGVSLE